MIRDLLLICACLIVAPPAAGAGIGVALASLLELRDLRRRATS